MSKGEELGERNWEGESETERKGNGSGKGWGIRK